MPYYSGLETSRRKMPGIKTKDKPFSVNARFWGPLQNLRSLRHFHFLKFFVSARKSFLPTAKYYGAGQKNLPRCPSKTTTQCKIWARSVQRIGRTYAGSDSFLILFLIILFYVFNTSPILTCLNKYSHNKNTMNALFVHKFLYIFITFRFLSKMFFYILY